jgi:hypothetical protein
MVLGLAAGALVSVGLKAGTGMAPALEGGVWLYTSLAVAILVAGFLGVFLWRKRADLKKGQPADDERSSKIKAMAGYYAFMSSLYFVLGLMFFGGVEEGLLLSRHAIVIVMLGMAGFFLGFWTYLNGKADVELPE